MSSSLALTMPCRRPTTRSQGWTFAPVRVWVGDHGRPYVDVVGNPGPDIAHPIEQHLRARAHDAGQGRDVQPGVAVQLGKIIDLPAEVRGVVEVERVAGDTLLIRDSPRRWMWPVRTQSQDQV